LPGIVGTDCHIVDRIQGWSKMLNMKAAANPVADGKPI
jgi:hypothetical protein